MSLRSASIPLCQTIADAVLDAQEQDFSSEVTSLCALRHPDLHCESLNTKGHDEYSCDYLVQCVLSADQIRKDPTIKDKVFNKCK